MPSNGPNWNQLGVDVMGVMDSEEELGISVAISFDGSIVAAGARLAENDGVSAGAVRVFEVTPEGNLMQLGEDIAGEAELDLSGYAVALSGNGTVLAVGAPTNSNDNGFVSGHVRVYVFDGSNWNQIGSDIDGESTEDLSGFSVSLSLDGSVLAVGAALNDGSFVDAGQTRVYDFVGGEWIQRGRDLDGESAGDEFGYDVALSNDGNVVAVAGRLNDDGATDAGHVRVLAWNGTAWEQRGQDIDGEGVDDLSGFSIAISGDGLVVAIGAPNNDNAGVNAGYTRIFSFDEGLDQWIQIGQDIEGDSSNFGFAVALSNDGNVVAIGGPANTNLNGFEAGHVQVFELVASAWVQVGTDIEGSLRADRFGISVALSADGSRLAAGARTEDGDGYAAVFEFGSVGTGTTGSQQPSTQPSTATAEASLPSMAPSATATSQMPSTRPSATDTSQMPSTRPSATDTSQMPSTRPSATDTSQMPSSRPSAGIISAAPSGKPSMLTDGAPSPVSSPVEPLLSPSAFAPSSKNMQNANPLEAPSSSPSTLPSAGPSSVPSLTFPSLSPSSTPSVRPSMLKEGLNGAPSPVSSPVEPLLSPSAFAPSSKNTPKGPPPETPSSIPSTLPSTFPSSVPSLLTFPSLSPSNTPSGRPSMLKEGLDGAPSPVSSPVEPLLSPSAFAPSSKNTPKGPPREESDSPSTLPSTFPSSVPSLVAFPSLSPSNKPSMLKEGLDGAPSPVSSPVEPLPSPSAFAPSSKNTPKGANPLEGQPSSSPSTRPSALKESPIGAAPPVLSPTEQILAPIPPSPGFPVCNVCGPDNLRVTNPGALVEINGLDPVTCADFQRAGDEGFVQAEFCALLPGFAQMSCDCQEIDGGSAAS